MTSKENRTKTIQTRWRGLFLLTFAFTFLYVFFEWLFEVTKPSFMTSLPWLSKIEILLFVAFLAATISLLFVWLLYLLSKSKFASRIIWLFFGIAAIIPTFVMTALITILVDNFTYTIFNFGIVSTDGIIRALYGIGFIVIFYVLFRHMNAWAGTWGKRILNHTSGWKIGAGFALIASLAILPALIRTGDLDAALINSTTSTTMDRLPNIFLVTSDGLNADHMSLYGYERETTPFLDSWADTSLVADNAFPNSAKTGGSIMSILKGKNPLDFRLIFPPDILHNEDAYQHLPGILKSLGYYSVQYGVHYYVDAFAQNMQYGFDEVNGRRAFKSKYEVFLSNFIPGDYAYFIYNSVNRIFDRLRHIFFILKMDNSFLQVQEVSSNYYDSVKIEGMNNLLQNHDLNQPLFVHLHWMGTHGDIFFLKKQVFSVGKDSNAQIAWDVDFYDDSILEFDSMIRNLVATLEDNGMADNSIIVIASDHGQHWVTNERLPLLFHFPDNAYRQELKINVQNLDIAPTLLGYLHIDQPAWMSGESLLNGLEDQRLVFAVDVGNTIKGEDVVQIDEKASIPPFYQFGKITMIDCDRYYELSLNAGFFLKSSFINEYTTPCQYQVQSENEVLQLMIGQLKRYQFNTDTLEAWAETYVSP